MILFDQQGDFMPLKSRYTPSEMITVLNKCPSFTRHNNYLNAGGVEVPSYYETDQCIVVSPATDTKSNHQMLQTIQEGLQRLPKSIDLQKKILIPIAEEQKILGLFPRNHWVTLQYDPKNNTATILDSRPWLVSFLYPMTAMKQQLKAGIEHLYGKEKAQAMIFTQEYQGVQFNDTYCGAWTSKNIIDLATNNDVSIEQQKVKYSYKDEPAIIQHNITLVTDSTVAKPKERPASSTYSIMNIITQCFHPNRNHTPSVAHEGNLDDDDGVIIQHEETEQDDFELIRLNENSKKAPPSCIML